jgi:hypothetical protein
MSDSIVSVDLNDILLKTSIESLVTIHTKNVIRATSKTIKDWSGVDIDLLTNELKENKDIMVNAIYTTLKVKGVVVK